MSEQDLNTQVIVAFFETGDAADSAAKALMSWDKANDDVKLGTMGRLSLSDKGKLETKKYGSSNTGRGLLIGGALGLVTAGLTGGLSLLVGAVAGGAIGGVAGKMTGGSLGLSDSDLASIQGKLTGDATAVVVLCDDFEVKPTKEELKKAGGDAHSFGVSNKVLQAVHEERRRGRCGKCHRSRYRTERRDVGDSGRLIPTILSLPGFPWKVGFFRMGMATYGRAHHPQQQAAQDNPGPQGRRNARSARARRPCRTPSWSRMSPNWSSEWSGARPRRNWMTTPWKSEHASLNRQYFDGRLQWQSIRWVTNQNKRYGSCTPAHGTIRIAHQLADMPRFVQDYVIVHELAHLLEANHGPNFGSWSNRFPKNRAGPGLPDGRRHGRDGSGVVAERRQRRGSTRYVS